MKDWPNEDEANELTRLRDESARLRADNEHLRRALRWYAERTIDSEDCGEIARETLAAAPNRQGEVKAPATIAELEAILNSEDSGDVTINSDGTISTAPSREE